MIVLHFRARVARVSSYPTMALRICSAFARALALVLLLVNLFHDAIEALPAPKRPAPIGRASIFGSVRSEVGAPIAGARVCATLISNDLASRDPSCADTDARGAYRIADLPAASYAIAATATAHRVASGGIVRAGGRLDLVLEGGGVAVTGQIFAQVRSPSRFVPLPHAHARVTTADGAIISVDADASGRFEVWTAPEPISVTALAAGHTTARATVQAPTFVHLAVMPESTLAGVVIDATTGAPVAGVRVTAELAEVGASGTNDEDGRNTALTDDAGRFEIRHLLAGHYTAVARAVHGYGRSAEAVAVALGGRGAGPAVRLYPAHQIRGRVDQPCADASAILYDRASARYAIVDREPDGSLRADGVVPGTYEAWPACSGLSFPGTSTIVVGDGDVDATWHAETGSGIRGRVTRGGRPVDGAGIVVRELASPAHHHSETQTTRTGRDGTYAVTGLLDDRYRVEVEQTSANGANVASREDLVDITGTVVHDVDLGAPLGAIAGHVVDQAHRPARNLILSLRADGASDRTAPIIAFTDDAGDYALELLEPGHYHVTTETVTDPLATTADVVVTADHTSRLDLAVALPTGVIRGHVWNPDGTPARDAFVTTGAREVLVDEGGGFVLEGLGAGPFTVVASRHTGGEAIARDIAPGEDIALAFVPTGSIGGHLYSRGADDLRLLLTDASGRIVRQDLRFHTGGRFELDDIASGRYHLIAMTGRGRRTVDVDVPAGGRVNVDVALDDLVTVVGRAVDIRTGTPYWGIEMMATPGDDDGETWTAEPANTSDVDGRFVLHNVPRGAVRISGFLRNDAAHAASPASLERTLPATGDTIDIGDVPVIDDSVTTGVVDFSPAIRTVSGARAVTADRVVGTAQRAGLVTGDVITAIDGIDVTGEHADFAQPLLAVAPGSTIKLTLERGATVTLPAETP